MNNNQPSKFALAIQHTYLGKYLIFQEGRYFAAFVMCLFGTIAFILVGLGALAKFFDWPILQPDSPYNAAAAILCLGSFAHCVGHFTGKNLGLAMRFAIAWFMTMFLLIARNTI